MKIRSGLSTVKGIVLVLILELDLGLDLDLDLGLKMERLVHMC